MAFKKVALAVCFMMATEADQGQDIDSYLYYNVPTSDNVIDHGFAKSSTWQLGVNPQQGANPEQGVNLQQGANPGALVGLLAMVSLLTKFQFTAFKL